MSPPIEQNRKAFFYWTVISAAIIGLVSVVLVRLGNPPNMGICAACFVRDTAGGINLFAGPAPLQYLRPEIPGFILGAFAAALVFKDFRASGGSSPLIRFVLAAFVMIGAMVFLGCPIRLMVRLGGGDYATTGIGLAGLLVGAGAASLCIRSGFSLGRGSDQSRFAGMAAPLLALGLLGFILLLAYGKNGDPKGLLETKWAAPLLAAFALAFLAGLFAQRSRFCTVGGFRDAYLAGDFRLLSGYGALLVAIVAGNLIVDACWPGSVKQFQFGAAPIAHSEHLWNFLGMVLVGWGAVLLGGCPFRQLIAAGQGSSDAGVVILGMMFGAAFCHNFGLAAKPATAEAAGGPGPAGMTAVGVGIAICLAAGLLSRQKIRA